MLHVFPGATREDAEECARDNGVFWVQRVPEDAAGRGLVPITIQGPLHSQVKAWFKTHRPGLLPVEPAPGFFRLADTRPDRRSLDVIRTFVPKGALVLQPDVGTFVQGSTIKAAVEFAGDSANERLNLYPSMAAFDWTVVDANGQEVLTGPLFEGRGTRIYEFELSEKGRYEVRVTVSSRWFSTGDFTPPPVSILVVSEAQREKEVFDLLLTGPGEEAPFERVGSELRLKPGAEPLSVDREVEKADFWVRLVDRMQARGQITEEQAEEFREVWTDRKEMLEEKRELLTGTTPYIAYGSFLDATTSAYLPLQVALRGERRNEGSSLGFSFRLLDFTLAPYDPPLHSGEAEVEVAFGDEQTATRRAEIAALDELAGHWQSNNSYPDGTVRLVVRLSDGTLYERPPIDTRSAKKDVQQAAGKVALVLGAVALGISLINPVGILFVVGTGAGVLAAGAGLTDVGLRLEQRIQTHTLHADRQVALDCLQVAATIAGIGGMARAVRSGRVLSDGRLLVGMAGLDVAQGMVLTADVQARILEVEADYHSRAAALQEQGNAVEGDLKALAVERDTAVANILGEAAIGGGFLLVSLGRGVKDIRNHVRRVAASGDPRLIRNTLGTDRVLTPDEVRQLNTALEAAEPPARIEEPPTATAKVEEPLPAPPRVEEPVKPEARVEEPPPATAKIEEPAKPGPKVEEPGTPEKPRPPRPASPEPAATVRPVPEVRGLVTLPAKPVRPGELRYDYQTWLRSEVEHPVSEARRARAAELAERLAGLDKRQRNVDKVTRQLDEAEIEAREAALEEPKTGEAPPPPFDEKAHQAARERNAAEQQQILADTVPLMHALQEHANSSLSTDMGGTPAQMLDLQGRLNPPEIRGLHIELGRERFVKLLGAGPDVVGRFLDVRRQTNLTRTGRLRLLEILDLHRSGALDDARLSQALDECRDFLTLYPNGIKGDFRRMAAAFDPAARVSTVEALPTSELYLRAQSGDADAAHELELRRQSLSTEELQTAAQQAEQAARRARKAKRKDEARSAKGEQDRLRTLLAERNVLFTGVRTTDGPFTTHPELRRVLENDLRKSRVVGRIDIPQSDAAVEGGTLGAARTDIPGVGPRKLFLGRSPKAHAEGEASTINPRYKAPAETAAAHGHAEQTLVGNLADDIDQLIKAGKLTQADLQGKTVWMLIDQEVCSYCGSGLDSPVAPGVLAQFSQDFPLLTIQIKNLRTSDLIILRGGRRIN